MPARCLLLAGVQHDIILYSFVICQVSIRICRRVEQVILTPEISTARSLTDWS
jgi:hypothetical protein